MTREARGRWGKGGGFGGGGRWRLCPECAGAAWGRRGRGRLAAPHAAAAPPLHCVSVGAPRTFPGKSLENS